jgi:hypothetical protein
MMVRKAWPTGKRGVRLQLTDSQRRAIRGLCHEAGVELGEGDFDCLLPWWYPHESKWIRLLLQLEWRGLLPGRELDEPWDLLIQTVCVATYTDDWDDKALTRSLNRALLAGV